MNRLRERNHRCRYNDLELFAHRLGELGNIAIAGPFGLGVELGVDLHVVDVSGLTFLGAADHGNGRFDFGKLRQRVLDVL